MPATALRSDLGTGSDHDTLLALNRDYIASVQGSDVARFDEILAEDFLCSHPDGSLVDRATFLAQAARPVAIRNLAAEDVVVRLLGDVAIIHAATRYLKPDGAEGRGRYTDAWARRDGRWLCVSAHVTRC
ncbi:MAG: nuclear transport factor 2 family protein [Microvirga sp.]